MTIYEINIAYDPTDIDRRWFSEVLADDGHKTDVVFRSPRLHEHGWQAEQEAKDWMRGQANERRRIRASEKVDRCFIEGHLWCGGRLWSDRGTGMVFLTPNVGPYYGLDLTVSLSLMKKLIRRKVVVRTCHDMSKRRFYHLP